MTPALDANRWVFKNGDQSSIRRAAPNMNVRIALCGLSIALLFYVNASAGQSSTDISANPSPTVRFIVKRHSRPNARLTTLHVDRKTAQRLRSDVDGFEVYVGAAADSDATLQALRDQPDVEYVVMDRRRHALAVPSDTLYGTQQWYLQNTQPAAIAANIAWDTTTGSNGTVVAVLDTGIRFDHPDLQRAEQGGKVLPGYDFVSAESGGGALTANDGDGWDGDPSDPGDWIDTGDKAKSLFADCDISDSSWHGTRVAGLIAAASNNGTGIAGTSWNTYILPVRVLGKCGGYDSDILIAMRWAAGIHISGVPDNPYPAKIINMSLGSVGSCTSAYRNTIAELTQLGVLVVISAGNEGGPVDEPANCPGALAVAGLRHVGTKVGYSSLGPEVSIAAPAGNCFNLSGACLYSLVSTTDSGTTTPASGTYTDQFNNANLGTSFSAPLAAGVAALMHAANAKLSATQLRQRLQEGSSAFPNNASLSNCRVPTGPNDIQLNECNCTTNTCGTGMLYAPGAVTAAQRPIATIAAPTSVAAGALIALDGSGSSAACGRTIAGFGWSVVAANGISSPAISNADQSIASVAAPTSGSFTLRLTVTDDTGATDSATIQVFSNTAISSATPTSGGSACPVAIAPNSTQQTSSTASTSADSTSSSGGGTFSWCLIATLWLVRATRRVRAPIV